MLRPEHLGLRGLIAVLRGCFRLQAKEVRFLSPQRRAFGAGASPGSGWAPGFRPSLPQDYSSLCGRWAMCPLSSQPPARWGGSLGSAAQSVRQAVPRGTGSTCRAPVIPAAGHPLSPEQGWESH